MNKTRFVEKAKVLTPRKSLERQLFSKTIMSSTATISPYLFQTQTISPERTRPKKVRRQVRVSQEASANHTRMASIEQLVKGQT
jgi:hypothetical protein